MNPELLEDELAKVLTVAAEDLREKYKLDHAYDPHNHLKDKSKIYESPRYNT